MRYVAFRLLLTLTLFTASLAQLPAAVDQAGWTSDGAYLVTSRDRDLQVLDGSDGHLVKTAPVPGPETVYVSFSPDSGREEPNSLRGLAVSGRYALTGGGDRNLLWWTVPELQVVTAYQADYGLQGLSLGGEGRVAGYADSSTRYLDSSMMIVRLVEDEAIARGLPDLIPPYSSETFGVPRISPGGDWAVGRVDDTVRLWRLESEEITSRELPGISVGGLRLGREHFYVLGEGQVEQYAYADPTTVLRSFPTPALDADVDAGEQRLVVWTGSSLATWTLTGSEPPRSWDISCHGMQLCPDGRKVLLRFEDRFEAWNLEEQRKLFEVPIAQSASTD